jgi:hypothetical protein
MLRAALFVDRARGGEASEAGVRTRALLAGLLERLRTSDIDAVIARGLPLEIADLTAGMVQLSEALQEELFDVTATVPRAG